MLAKNFRLRSSDEIREVFQEGRVLSGRYFLLKYLNNGRNNFRLAVSLNSKIISKAVDRNRLKRIIKEYFRQSAGNLWPVDILLVGRPALRGIDEASVKKELNWLIRKLKEEYSIKS